MDRFPAGAFPAVPCPRSLRRSRLLIGPRELFQVVLPEQIPPAMVPPAAGGRHRRQQHDTRRPIAPFRHNTNHAIHAPAATPHHSSTPTGQYRSTTTPPHTAASTITNGWYAGVERWPSDRLPFGWVLSVFGECSTIRAIVANDAPGQLRQWHTASIPLQYGP